MAYCNAQHLAGLATNGWAELAQRACPDRSDMEPALLQAVATGQSTAAWPSDLVEAAQAGLARINVALDMASRHVDTYLYPKYRDQMPLPQAVVDTSPLPDVAGWLAIKRLYGTSLPEEVAKAMAQATEYLRDVSKGTVSLGVGDTVQPTPGHTVTRTPAKAFDWGGY